MAENENQQKGNEQGVDQDANKGTGLKNSFLSGLAALFGIQSNKNRERDFKQGNASDFLITGIIILVCLLVSMLIVVKIVISNLS